MSTRLFSSRDKAAVRREISSVLLNERMVAAGNSAINVEIGSYLDFFIPFWSAFSGDSVSFFLLAGLLALLTEADDELVD
jgi:hypothetical protein